MDARPVEQALAYGEEGLWYDAIALVAQAETAEERDARTNFLRSLANAESARPSWQEMLLGIADATATN